MPAVVFLTSKSTTEGQTLAKESTVYLVQLSVGERNFILKDSYLKHPISMRSN